MRNWKQKIRCKCDGKQSSFKQRQWFWFYSAHSESYEDCQAPEIKCDFRFEEFINKRYASAPIMIVPVPKKHRFANKSTRRPNRATRKNET